MPGYTMHVVSHTHWDREWYLPFQRFRIRLVDLMDHLLEIFERDLTLAKKGVDRLVKVPLNDNQYGVLVSFVHNLGEGAFAGSTLLKKVNSKDFAAVPNELLKWVNIRINGKLTFSQGLWNRRKAEGALWSASSSSPVQKTPETTKASPEATEATEGLLVKIIKLIFGVK